MARPKKKHQGFGDTVEAVLETTGIKKVVEIFVDGKDCGCEERKQKLNELLPYKFKARCLTEEEFISWSEFIKVRSLKTMEWEQVVYVCDLYASVFSRQKWYPCVGCSPKPLLSMIDKLDKVYETYEN